VAHRHLEPIHAAVRAALPTDEPVVLRYVTIVAVLLTRVARADGYLAPGEIAHLRQLLQGIDGMPLDGIDELCRVLDQRVPKLGDDDIAFCARELKSICDAEERINVMRLLANQATADGEIATVEHSALLDIAALLDVPLSAMAELEDEAGR
jgi:DnaJ like chaperone protein